MINRGVKSVDFILPAPIGGLNKRDPLSDMIQSDAIVMDNYIPTENTLKLRGGYLLYATLGAFSKTNKIETLASYQTPELSRMIAVFGGKAYQVSKGSVRLFENVNFQKSRCQTVQYKNYLYFMNGVDVPKVYYVDALGQEHFENWGFEASNLPDIKIISGAVSHEFLWFVEKNSTRAFVSSVAGNVQRTLSVFDLAQVIKWGGHLVGVTNWTVDGGTGIDDYTCFLTSEGEVLIYKGYDPSDADNFSMIGSYKLSPPIGYQCMLPFQGDVVIICQDGYIPLSKALSSNNAMFSSVAFSDKIRGLVLQRTLLYKYLEGWQGIIYSKKGYGIFNVPVGKDFEQHVININTGAWCRFTNIRAFCWCQYDGDLYFGSDNAVYQFDSTYSDNGQPIEGHVEQAYTNLGINRLKKIQLLNPRTRSLTNFKLTVYANMDYEERALQSYINVGYVGETKWSKAKWGKAKWQSLRTKKIQSQWIGHSSTGVKASLVFQTKTAGNVIEWYETGLRYETGTGVM